ncbi:DUF4913 domain-containing protein [Nocardioides soli]|uniref:DUF4913 domain-containing protein n=1 Tax=Nocardioides soli TaxID=1036020 RepID=UPI003CCE4A24
MRRHRCPRRRPRNVRCGSRRSPNSSRSSWSRSPGATRPPNDVVRYKQWWAYTAAVVRLEALWCSYEHLRWGAGFGGVSVWLRDHADPQVAVLLDPNGPFKCAGGAGHDAERERVLPFEQAPGALFMPGDWPPNVTARLARSREEVSERSECRSRCCAARPAP